MRSVILLVFGLGMLCGGVPSQMTHAQSDGGIVRLSSAAYGPNSPVQENRLFRYQTSRYGFAYNCDGEEDKRNHPAIAWQAADGEMLPKRMGCLARVRHEVAQVSRRILDGMCDTGGCNCQQQRKPSCACPNCLAETVPTNVASANLAPATVRRSGLIRLTQVDSFTEAAQSNNEILVSDQQVESESTGFTNPAARTASALTTEVLTAEASADSTDSHRLGLVERLKIMQSSQGSDTTEGKKF